MTSTSTQPIIELNNVGLRYPLHSIRHRRGFKHLLKRLHKEHFWALRNVTFNVETGGILGIIGRNGSGKSTLAHVLAGVFTPDEGEAVVRGSANVLAPGGGVIPDLTGRENILVNGAYLGHDQKEMRDKVDEILEFADLGRFVDQPVKTYSSGMKSKLSFSIALTLQPDILIIDETLSAGDAAFKERAKQGIQEVIGRARAVIIIAHQLPFLKSICTDMLWLDQGQVAMRGKPGKVIDEYQASVGIKKAQREKVASD